MYRVQNSPLENEDWVPTATAEAMQARAALYETIRNFFKARSVLEVETPLLCERGVTDINIQAIPALYSQTWQAKAKSYYLQTSPEFAMKRLLAAGIGSMYQMCKAFRNGERGRLHNPEFTILEWYRLGFDHHQLMDECEAFLSEVLGTTRAIRLSYRELFLQYLAFDPHAISLPALKAQMSDQITISNISDREALTKDDWLDLCMTHCIEPHLKGSAPFMIYDYPASQAALAKIRQEPMGIAVGERFEIYVEGVELANGYHELCDPAVQLARFQQDNQARIERGMNTMDIDIRLMDALKAGLPSSAGVALGVDRLLMLKLKQFNIDSVISFPIDRA